MVALTSSAAVRPRRPGGLQLPAPAPAPVPPLVQPSTLAGKTAAGSPAASGALQHQSVRCSVCWFGPAPTVDQPVRHACLCVDCYINHSKCPVCGATAPRAARRELRSFKS
ncbi:hypothetical protein ACP4OV_010999 [Aristida adscensionis]